MIVLDIETTGVSPTKNRILSLGAVDFQTGKEFYKECYAWQYREVDPVALQINGFTMEQVQDRTKRSPEQLYIDFVQWVKDEIPVHNRILAGHNIGHLDILFLEDIHNSFQVVDWLFGYRTVDLHTLAFARFNQSMNHANICRALGLSPEPTPHNALEGARSEAAAFRLLLK